MDVLSSAEFRKRYARLTDRTEVTVNGHVIGTWVPVNAPFAQMVPGPRLVADEDVVDHELGTPEQRAAAAGRLAEGKPGTTMIERYSTRPFTPVPKSRR